jgi:NifU-like protein involved in Fe-S cluster formation
MEYSSEVVRRCDAPRRAGELPRATPGLVSGEAYDRTLQVWVRFDLQVLDGVIQTARFEAFGCPHTVAAADLAAERLEGCSIEAARRVDARDLGAALGVPAEKLGKLLRIEDAAAACWANSATTAATRT